LGIGLPFLNSKPLTLTFKIPINGFSRFFEELKNGRVMATKCRGCGKLYFPPVAECGECFSSGMDWVELDGEGEVEAFTHVVVRPESFKRNPPYTLVVARLKEGVKVFAKLSNVDLAEVRVGMKVKLKTKIVGDEAIYEFTPV